MDETWKEIEDFSGYLVSNLGRIKNTNGKKPLILKQRKVPQGYLRVWLKPTEGERVFCYAHRLVAKAFIPNPENKSDINHKDGDKTHNEVYNLEWCTSKENRTHAQKSGLITNKLTEDDVKEIKRRLSEEGGYGINRKLAKEYGVKDSLIGHIKHSRRWKYI